MLAWSYELLDGQNCVSPNFGKSSLQFRRFNVSALISIFLDLMIKESVQFHVMLVRPFWQKTCVSPLWFHWKVLIPAMWWLVCGSNTNNSSQFLCKYTVCMHLQTHIVRSHAGANFRDYNALPLTLCWDIKMKYNTIQKSELYSI